MRHLATFLFFLVVFTAPAQAQNYVVSGTPDADGIYVRQQDTYGDRPYYKVPDEELYLYFCGGIYFETGRCTDDAYWMIGTELPVSGVTPRRTILYLITSSSPTPPTGVYVQYLGAGEASTVSTTAATSLEAEPATLAERFVLEAAYPNPFNPSATIRFAVQEAVPVRVGLYDVMGREVRVLYEGTPPTGTMMPVHIDGSGLPSGSYLVRLTGQGISATQQVTLLK